MNKIKLKILFKILPIALLFSCDPGYNVILQNNSGSEVNVDLIYSPDSYHKSMRDFFIYDSIVDNFGSEHYNNKIIVRCDSLTNIYTFKLKNNSSAIVDYGRNSPRNNLQIIINKWDTLSYNKKSNYRIKGNFMSKTYLFTIENK